MQRARRMRVIEIQRMRHGAIDQRGTRRRIALRIPKYGGGTARQAKRAGCGQKGGRAFRLMPAAQHIADQVKYQETCAFLHICRQAFITKPGDKGGEFAGDGDHGVSPQI